MRDSNLSKTFHLDISKEGLENEFNGNYERIQSRSRTETNGSDDVFSWTTTDKLEAAMRRSRQRNRWRKLTAERDELQVQKFRRVNEFIQEFQERHDTDVGK